MDVSDQLKNSTSNNNNNNSKKKYNNILKYLIVSAIFIYLFIYFFFGGGEGSLHARLISHYEAWNYKKDTKRLKHTLNLFRKNLQIKGAC